MKFSLYFIHIECYVNTLTNEFTTSKFYTVFYVMSSEIERSALSMLSIANPL